MAWIKVPPENHPLFHAALPRDRRVETIKMFGGVAAKVNGNIFAGLFGRSAMVWLPEAERAEALALEGAERFDPMGDGRARSDKIMLPESMMDEPDELRGWLARAFKGAAALPPKTKTKTPKTKTQQTETPHTKTKTRQPQPKTKTQQQQLQRQTKTRQPKTKTQQTKTKTQRLKTKVAKGPKKKRPAPR